MTTTVRLSGWTQPTPAWSLASAARDLDTLMRGLSTSRLEALLRRELSALGARYSNAAQSRS